MAPHAPLLTRSTEEWQIGVEPEHALVLRGSKFRRVLPLLDGTHSLAEIKCCADEVGLSERQLRTTLAALAGAGLLDGSRSAATNRRQIQRTRSPQAHLRLIGAGPVGRQIALGLAAAGVANLHIFDDAAPEIDLYPLAGAQGTRAQAACASLPVTTSTTATVINHWSKPDSTPIALTVVATQTPEVDRVLTDHFLRHDEPHLLVRSLGRSVTVGPLVVPGRTSCVRCADLSRRDADPGWPWVLNQLTRMPMPAPAPLVAWAAQTAVVQSLAFLAGSAPESAGATLELDDWSYAMRWRSWAIHSGCGCGWTATTEWGA